MLNKLYFNIDNISKQEKDWVFSELEKEKEFVGYYSLPEQNIDNILEFEKSISNDIKTVIVLGIGGSSLGAKAVYEFIKPVKDLKRKLYFFESTDPIYIKDTLNKIDLEKSHIFVISKSGTTIETIALFKYFYSLNNNLSNYTFITDKDSSLDKLSKEIKVKTFYIPSNVGGRFSIFSSAGLLPLVFCGINIKELLNGAKNIKNSFFENGYIKEVLLNKSLYYAKNHNQYNINTIFAYSESLEFFTKWYVQLWGESLGKKQNNSCFNVGMTPIGLIGPKDQHSFLQLIMQGTRDKSVTFIKIENKEKNIIIPEIYFKFLEELDIINNKSFSSLINMQCDSIKEALLEQKEIPVDEIIIEKVNEKNIGELMFYYEILTSLVGKLINIDTYNQPGVELGKIILKQKLRKN